MSIGDKPSIIARDAQEAAAAAKQAADALNAIPDIPGTSQAKKIALIALGGVVTIGGGIATAITLGTPAGWVVAGVGAVAWVAGLFHPTPQATATFGKSAL